MNRRIIRFFAAVLLVLLTLFPLSGVCAAAPTEETEPEWDMTPLPESWFDDAVFFGDSITNVLEQTTDVEGGLGEAQFVAGASYSVCNIADGTMGVWYRGKEYDPWEVLSLIGAPKAFFLLGTNDVDRVGGLDATMAAWEIMCDKIEENCPEIRFFIQSAMPVWHGVQFKGLNNENLLVYNEKLKAFCEDRGYVFVDLADYFRDDETGGSAEIYTSDYYVHLSEEGAHVWVRELKNPGNYSEDPRI